MQQATTLLPDLREDLQLLKGSAQEDGSPGWLLYDPLRNRYFSIDLLTFRLLKLWRGEESVTAAAERISATGVVVDEQKLSTLIHFLSGNGLTRSNGAKSTEQFKRQYQKQHLHWLQWLIHHYLFIRIPLLRPDPWLERILPWCAVLAGRRVQRTVQLLGVIGILLVLRQLETFTTTFLHFFSWEGIVLYGVALFFVKAMHEMAHALTAKQLGCRVTSMGVALLVLFPVLYTDTTDAWRLHHRRERLAIVLAGIRMELHLALLATFLWSFLADGPLRSAAFFIATTSWLTSLAINLSPFMRFDGYYALADWLGAANLQPRAFALGRWRLREALFGLNEPPPEQLSRSREHIFILYGWATWIYRLMLFLGIALLIYYFAFKLLGIALFAVEIIWFVLLPVHNEVSQWWQRREQLRWNRHTLTTLLLFATLLFAALIPWQSTLTLPAVVEATEFRKIFPPADARIQQVVVQPGQPVVAGDLLLVLESPELESRAMRTQRKIDLIQTHLQRRGGSRKDQLSQWVQFRALAEQQSLLMGIESLRGELSVHAPISGEVQGLAELRPGQWIAQSEGIADIVNTASWQISALLAEEDLLRIEPGATATFFANDGMHGKLGATVLSIDEAAVITLPWPSLASLHGGPIAVRPVEQTETALRPEQAYYRVQLQLNAALPSNPWRLPGGEHYPFVSI